MALALLAFIVSALCTGWIVRHLGRQGQRWLDHSFGPQKFHARAVPRIGGVGIFIGLAIASTVQYSMGDELLPLVLLGCGLPAFAAGLLEDITRRVSPRMRLLATAISAVFAIGFMQALIVRTDIPGLDWVVSYSVGAATITILSVAGVANSVNIIDGFNGLASMCVVLMMAALTYVAFQVGDPVVATLLLAGMGAVLGFFLWNFPAGLIFLGDGGAYFLGFFVAEASILLLARNSDVSPLFPLLVCIYPVFETLFSIYRRRFLRAVPPSMPDGIHLHSLIYRRLLRWAVGDYSAKALTRRNSMTAPYLWMLCMFSVVPAVLFWNNTPVLALFLFLFGLSYVTLYWRIVRFRSPRWLRFAPARRRLVAKADNRRT